MARLPEHAHSQRGRAAGGALQDGPAVGFEFQLVTGAGGIGKELELSARRVAGLGNLSSGFWLVTFPDVDEDTIVVVALQLYLPDRKTLNPLFCRVDPLMSHPQVGAID